MSTEELAGSGLLEDLDGLNKSMSSGSWLGTGLSGLAVVGDIVGMMVDPIGTLIGALPFCWSISSRSKVGLTISLGTVMPSRLMASRGWRVLQRWRSEPMSSSRARRLSWENSKD